MQNPCYDKPTKTDCPERKPGCGANCPKWAKYVEERNQLYKERNLESVIRNTLSPDHQKRIKHQIRNTGSGFWKR